MTSPLIHRHIRSFVRRQGKITVGQRRARELLSDRWILPFTSPPLHATESSESPEGPAYLASSAVPCLLSPAELFGNDHPVVLEIGFGMGETTAEIAWRNPAMNFLCLEVYPAGIGALLQRIEDRRLNNIRIIEHDAVEVVRHGLPLNSLTGVHLYFPDPWPKKRHHKRRLVQAPFIAELVQRIVPGGYFHSATDWPEYAQQMLTVLSAEPELENTAEGFAPRPDWRPKTKFEARGLRLGHPVADLIFKRRRLSIPVTTPASPAASSE